jgi:hypothetical protein
VPVAYDMNTTMSFAEVQAEVQGWSPEQQSALLAFLNVLQFRRAGVDPEELRRAERERLLDVLGRLAGEPHRQGD